MGVARILWRSGLACNVLVRVLVFEGCIAKSAIKKHVWTS